MGNVYEIKRIITKSGENRGKETERSIRRKGHKAELIRLELGQPLVFRYLDGSGYLETSNVEAYGPADYRSANHITVQTRNSVYSFGKVSDNAGA